MTRIVILLLVACSTSGPPQLETTSLGSLEYGAPAGWRSRDLSTPRNVTIEWTPPNNEAKRAITIIRAERPALAANVAHVERLLAEAVRGLPRGSFAPTTRFTSRNGLAGVRVEGTFVPAGQTRTYQRMHAILLVDDALVHVVATAVSADREELDAVVESVHRKGV